MIDLITRVDLTKRVDVAYADVARGVPVPIRRWQLERMAWWPWVATTPLLSDSEWDGFGEFMAKRYVGMETQRRAVVLTLALDAWKAEHGRLPSKLEELVGTYLDRMPLDPYSGKPFWYYPKGLPIRLKLEFAYAWEHCKGSG